MRKALALASRANEVTRAQAAKTRGAVAALAERIPVPKVIGDALAKGAARGADDSMRKLRLDPDQ